MESPADFENPYACVTSGISEVRRPCPVEPLKLTHFLRHALVFGLVFGVFSFLMTCWQPVPVPVRVPSRNVVFFRPNVPEWSVVVRRSEDWWLSFMMVGIGLHHAARAGRRTEMHLLCLLGYAFLGAVATGAAGLLVFMHPFVTQTIATELRFLTFIPTTWFLTVSFMAGCGYGFAGGRSFVMCVACFLPVLALHFTIHLVVAQFVDLTDVLETDQKTYVITRAMMNGLETFGVFFAHLASIGLVYRYVAPESPIAETLSTNGRLANAQGDDVGHSN